MKAITIWQPWASLLACGAKKYETRSWATHYRGPIAIHAAATPLQRVLKKIFPLHEWEYAPDHTLKSKFLDWVSRFVDLDALAYGAVIATAELVECWYIVHHPGADIDAAKHIPVGAELDVPKHHPRFGDIIVPTEQELLFGDWTPGRYAWEFANMKMLDEPIPAKGGQRIWNWMQGVRK